MKTAPDAVILAKFADLYTGLAAIAPNCCLQQKRVELALDICSNSMAIYKGADIPHSRMASSLGLIVNSAADIRTAFSKYRMMVREKRFWQAVQAKAHFNFIPTQPLRSVLVNVNVSLN